MLPHSLVLSSEPVFMLVLGAPVRKRKKKKKREKKIAQEVSAEGEKQTTQL